MTNSQSLKSAPEKVPIFSFYCGEPYLDGQAIQNPRSRAIIPQCWLATGYQRIWCQISGQSSENASQIIIWTEFRKVILRQVRSQKWMKWMNYSWPTLVVPYTEEPFSRFFVGENRFWLVLQAGMGPKNAIGCFFSPPGTTFFCPLHAHCFRCSVCISNGFVLKEVTWICQANKSMWPALAQIHLKCTLSSGSSVHV